MFSSRPAVKIITVGAGCLELWSTRKICIEHLKTTGFFPLIYVRFRLA